MRVSCEKNTGVSLSIAYKEKGYDDNVEFPLLIGKSYVVYGITLWTGQIWYLIVGENKQFPEWLPEELFIVSETKLSKYWHYNKNQTLSENQIKAVWGYKELVEQSSHYDKLVDQDEDVLHVFVHYKKMMDEEFADPTNSLAAKVLGYETWLVCPACNESWEATSSNPMVICPNCKSVMHNPLYQDKL